MFEIQETAEGQIRLSGRLDASEADRASSVLQGFSGPLTADLSGLEYISSAGLAVILATYKRLHGAGRSFRLTRLSPKIRNVFRYAGLDQVLEIE